MRMSKVGFHNLLAALFCGVAILPALAADDSAKTIPDFMAGGMGWNSAGQLTPVPGSPSPVVQDPKVKYVPNNVGGQPTWRVADVNNPNLTQFAKDGLKKANDMVAEGFALYNRTSRCWSIGVEIRSLGRSLNCLGPPSRSLRRAIPATSTCARIWPVRMCDAVCSSVIRKMARY